MGARARGRVAFAAPVALQPSPPPSISWRFAFFVFVLGFATSLCLIAWLLWPDLDVD